jgi:hypothetical protein
MPVLRFMGLPPNCDASGDIESMDLLARIMHGAPTKETSVDV